MTTVGIGEYEAKAQELLDRLPDDINEAAVVLGFMLVGLFRLSADPLGKFDEFVALIRRGIEQEQRS